MTDIAAARPDDASATPPVSREWARQQRQGGRRSDGPRSPEQPGEQPTPPSKGGRRKARVAKGGVSRRGVIAYGIATLVFVAGLVSLVWKGYDTSLDIKGGSSFETETDPAKPGYEAQVATVPDHLVIHVDSTGRMTEAQLYVELPSVGARDCAEGAECPAGAGVVMVIPGVTLVETDAGRSELSQYIADNGVEAGVAEIESILGFDVTDAVTLSPDALVDLFEPAGPVTIQNPDALIATNADGDKEIRYGAGPLTLQPSQIPEYLAFKSDGEAAINRSDRLELVWKAWMAAIAADPAKAPTAAPFTPVVGDADSVDLAGMVTRLSTATVSYTALPVETIPIPGAAGAAVYRPDPEAMAALVPSVVPYPTSAFPGQRARTRVLNGTADHGAATRAASPVVAAGAEITIFGNARTQDLATTTVEYHGDGSAAAAERIAAALGVTASRSTVPTEAYDVTVTLGADFNG